MSTKLATEIIGTDQLTEPGRPLTTDEVETLWRVFVRIEQIWSIGSIALSLRSQWLDMVRARQEDLGAEYVNAAAVLAELEEKLPERFDALVFGETIIRNRRDADTRLKHAKYYVVNDFVKCFILCGGFRTFGARNYAGFMGGSRFADDPPVRTGERT